MNEAWGKWERRRGKGTKDANAERKGRDMGRKGRIWDATQLNAAGQSSVMARFIPISHQPTNRREPSATDFERVRSRTCTREP